MKAKLNAEGKLIIEAENELESYALKNWLKENPFTDGDYYIYSSEHQKLIRKGINLMIVADRQVGRLTKDDLIETI